MNNRVTFALPSKGALAEPTIDFLKSCDLKVNQSNPRQYTATLPALPQVDVLFQRVNDIVYKIADGTVDLGITGLDVVHELTGDDGDVVILHENLRYGRCQLVLAVPETWLDVESMADIADIALELRETKHRNLRVATKFTSLARQFLHQHGVHHFTLVEAEGAIEAAPTLGYADIIIDLSATGTTLRENHLKPLVDGTLLDSTACLVGNLRRVKDSPEVLQTVQYLLEVFDATLNGQHYYQLRTNMRGESPEKLAHLVTTHAATRGLQGPTIAPVFSSTPDADHWFTVTVIVPSKQLMEAVAHLRKIGGAQTTVLPVKHVFMAQSPSYQKLRELLTKR
jgi:ATP phosphoribosyltransferase